MDEEPCAPINSASRVERFPWPCPFPDVVIHAAESAVKQHTAYQASKGGDFAAAAKLVSDNLDDSLVHAIGQLAAGLTPRLVPVHALERMGVNAIPAALADALATRLGWELELDIVQANVVNHTGASGFSRLARQAIFHGIAVAGDYVIVDDFIGQGGTIANLRGHLMSTGARILCATVLTGKPHSAPICQARSRLEELRAKHGEIETWWSERFGFGFNCLTASETRYLIGTPTAQRIRERIEDAAHPK